MQKDFISEGLIDMHYNLLSFECGNELSGIFKHNDRFFRYSIYQGGEKKVVEYAKEKDGTFIYMKVVSDEFF
jgi:hypothetical protein